jgi:DnaJ-class molecular chaperone
MDRRTYYMILGVSPTASAAGIRAAYHDLARRLHPDVAGEQATHAFQEVSEAYDVLSDPTRRRDYNEELRREERGAAIPVRRTSAAPTVREQSLNEEVFNIEVVLTPEEGRRGCMVPIGVPVLRRCPECGGSGSDWLLPCMACGHQGTVEAEQTVRVHIPPMARSGSIYEMSLQGFGIHNFYLRLHVFVEPQSP